MRFTKGGSGDGAQKEGGNMQLTCLLKSRYRLRAFWMAGWASLWIMLVASFPSVRKIFIQLKY